MDVFYSIKYSLWMIRVSKKRILVEREEGWKSSASGLIPRGRAIDVSFCENKADFYGKEADIFV